MIFDKDAGLIADNVDVQNTRDLWVKPEILSFEPVSAAQSSLGTPGDGLSNVS